MGNATKTPHDWRREASPLITLGYIHLFHLLKETARDLGYALTVHGSVCRDLDVVAVPWTEDAASFNELTNRLQTETGAALSQVTEKPHGRQAVLLVLPGGNGSVIDLSVMPLTPEAPRLEES